MFWYWERHTYLFHWPDCRRTSPPARESRLVVLSFALTILSVTVLSGLPLNKTPGSSILWQVLFRGPKTIRKAHAQEKFAGWLIVEWCANFEILCALLRFSPSSSAVNALSNRRVGRLLRRGTR